MKKAIVRLSFETSEPFASMTYGRYKPFLRLPELMLHKTIALGLLINDEPAGLVLAQARLRDISLEPTCELLSVFVAPEHRRGGHARALLNELSQTARDEGFTRLISHYNPETAKAAMIGALLASAGYSSPEPFLYRCCMNARDVVRAPILRHNRLPSGYEIRPWCALSIAQIKALKHRITNNFSYDDRLNPEGSSAPMECDCSLVLEYQGQIVGWMIARITAPGHLEYSSLFIAPEHRHSRTVVALIARAVNTQVQTNRRETYPTGCFVVLNENPRWRDSLLRAFTPYSDSVTPHWHMQTRQL